MLGQTLHSHGAARSCMAYNTKLCFRGMPGRTWGRMYKEPDLGSRYNTWLFLNIATKRHRLLVSFMHEEPVGFAQREKGCTQWL